MKKETLDKMKTEYGKIYAPKKTSAVKYHYIYNGVHVNVYFDAYDPDCYTLIVILALIDECEKKQYYMQNINVSEEGWHSRYLPGIVEYAYDIYKKIAPNNLMVDFWTHMENKLMEVNGFIINVLKDKCYENTCKWNQKHNQEIGMYIHYPRRVNMKKEHYEDLHNSLGIAKKDLDIIMELGFTIATTNDPNKRIELSVLMERIRKNEMCTSYTGTKLS